jgi:hypothetical protein
VNTTNGKKIVLLFTFAVAFSTSATSGSIQTNKVQTIVRPMAGRRELW